MLYTQITLSATIKYSFRPNGTSNSFSSRTFICMAAEVGSTVSVIDSRMSPLSKLDGTAHVYMHGLGGHTVNKLRKYDFGVVARLSPDIDILEIGINDLSFFQGE